VVDLTKIKELSSKLKDSIQDVGLGSHLPSYYLNRIRYESLMIQRVKRIIKLLKDNNILDEKYLSYSRIRAYIEIEKGILELPCYLNYIQKIYGVN